MSALPNAGVRGLASDWSSDQEVFKHVHWGKAMMWIFLLSDTFIFSCFLTSYMTVRASTTVPWPTAKAACTWRYAIAIWSSGSMSRSAR